MLDRKPMNRAITEAKKAFLEEEVPVGAVIVDIFSGKIIATAHNEMVKRKDPTAHAELLAIQRACLIKGKGRLEDCDIYVTLEPCPMCAQAMSFARLRRVYFGAYDPKGGGVDHGPRIFNSSSCHHTPETMGGIDEQKCSQLLIEFFKKKRNTAQ